MPAGSTSACAAQSRHPANGSTARHPRSSRHPVARARRPADRDRHVPRHRRRGLDEAPARARAPSGTPRRSPSTGAIVRTAAAAEAGSRWTRRATRSSSRSRPRPARSPPPPRSTDGLAPGPVRVRIGLHTGHGARRPTRATWARTSTSPPASPPPGHGGQVLVSRGDGARPRRSRRPLRELGEHRLKDIEGAGRASSSSATARFPPLRTISNTNLPRPASSSSAGSASSSRCSRASPAARGSLTLTGPGGSGKTRLAIEAAAALVPDFGAGVFWVGLASPARPRPRRRETIARSARARRTASPSTSASASSARRSTTSSRWSPRRPSSSALVAACPNLTVARHQPRAPARAGRGRVRGAAARRAEAVALFCERAQLEPSDEIAELCRAARRAPARRSSWPPPARGRSRRRRSSSGSRQRLDLLRGGRDADPRQQTLRATIEWSYDLLSDGEQAALPRASRSSPAAARSRRPSRSASADLDTLQSLVEKSLLRFSGERYWMLETIREYAAGAARARRRPRSCGAGMRAYFVALARGERARRCTARARAAASARLAPDYANVRAAVSYALAAGEPDDVGADPRRALSVPHLARATWPRCASGSRRRSPTRERLSPRGLAETLVGGGEIARFAGDLDRAVELKEELASVRRRAPAPQLEGGDARRSLRDRARPGRPRRCARVRGAERGGRRRGRACRLCFAELALRPGDLDRGGVAGPRGARRPGRAARSTTRARWRSSGRPPGARATPASPRERFARRRCASSRRSATAAGIADCLDGLARLAVRRRARSRRPPSRRRRADPRDARAAAGPERRPLPDVPDGGRDLTLDEAVAYALSATAEAGDR